MHTGDDIPLVKGNTPFSELVLEITGKRMGVTTVADDSGELLGIITDGDLRRAIEKKLPLDKIMALDVMTTNPKTITPGKLCVEALNIMEKYKITCLVVADKKKIVGIIHLHDILQAKVI